MTSGLRRGDLQTQPITEHCAALQITEFDAAQELMFITKAATIPRLLRAVSSLSLAQLALGPLRDPGHIYSDISGDLDLRFQRPQKGFSIEWNRVG